MGDWSNGRMERWEPGFDAELGKKKDRKHIQPMKQVRLS